MRKQDRLHVVRSAAEEDNALQVDPELAEGRSRPWRVILTALAALAIIIAVFYGINHQPAGTGETAATASPPPAPAAAPPSAQANRADRAVTNNVADQKQGSATPPQQGAAGENTGAAPPAEPAVPAPANDNRGNAQKK